MSTNYLFIVDTNSYAGDFERELCAYVTGQIGDCEVGSELADEANKEIPHDIRDWIYINIEHRIDDYGCSRPCAIHLTPDWNKYNSVEIYFSRKPTKEIASLFLERTKAFCSTRNIMLLNTRLLKEETSTKIVQVETYGTQKIP